MLFDQFIPKTDETLPPKVKFALINGHAILRLLIRWNVKFAALLWFKNCYLFLKSSCIKEILAYLLLNW